jgi:GNAT superfamily N-acetyltransferase
MSVSENALTNPAIIQESDYVDYLTSRGIGWLCEIESRPVGFAILDRKENNIWALFVKPGFEQKGIGKQLQRLMLNWYFEREKGTLCLTTGPGTRAEIFYRQSGWKETGINKNGAIVFEMTSSVWKEKGS